MRKFAEARPYPEFVQRSVARIPWRSNITLPDKLSDPEQAGIPFIVNSGYRTPAHNAAVGGVPNSAHLHGWAADISARTPTQKTRILQAARAAGFNRFGIYDTFIHLDCDPGKRGDVVWGDPFKT